MNHRIATLFLLSICAPALADTLELADGTKIDNCYVRDEGTRLLVWSNLSEVGAAAREYPRSAIKSYKIERGDAWDRKPELPDLSVTYIEMTPKLAGLHGVVNYDAFGRPSIGGAAALTKVEQEPFLNPAKAVEGVKLRYEPGEEITLTAHVKNLGFAESAPFQYAWLIDEKPVEEGRSEQRLGEMEETTFTLKWKWQEGRHHVTFTVDPEDDEIAIINNEARDPLWGWGLVYVVNPGRAAAWHDFRSAYGTFSFEDFYRWHIDIMNRLFADSVWPSTPDGVHARVRLDRIVYSEDTHNPDRIRLSDDGLRYDQGAWVWVDQPDRMVPAARTGPSTRADRLVQPGLRRPRRPRHARQRREDRPFHAASGADDALARAAGVRGSGRGVSQRDMGQAARLLRRRALRHPARSVAADHRHQRRGATEREG
jgi:hypothetical protein